MAAGRSTRPEAIAKARRIAAEIVPSFSATTYFRIGTRAARRVAQALYRVRLGYADDAALRAINPNASVVFVINHRSNMDYVIVTYMTSPTAALSYAVGEWAQVWPRYVAMATEAGVVQAVFPEGGLSRDGYLQAPKLGLLSYMVQGFDPKGPRDIIFVPVGINYDRVLEDRNLTAAAAAQPGVKPSFNFSPGIFIAYMAKMAGRWVVGRWYKHGYACVSFGAPISLRAHLAVRDVDLRTLPEADRHTEITHLGLYLMSSVGVTIPALPVPLVATALLEATAPVTLFELKGRVFELMSLLEQHGRYVHVPRDDRDYAIDVGLRLLALRRLVVEVDGRWRIAEGEGAILRYYAASIAHLFPVSGHSPAPAQAIRMTGLALETATRA
jgi:glycerol-3-phosphate O-acyltransferase